MTAAIGLVMSLLDIILGTFGLLLVLRMLLPVFKMRWDHPVMKIVTAVTDPVVNVTNRWLGIPSYGSAYRSSGVSRPDLLSAAAALVVLWAGRTVVVWVLQLVMLVPVWAAQPLSSVGNILTFILRAVFDLYGMALFVRIIFSWIRVPYTSPVSRFLWNITEPLLGPIRSAMPPLPGIDISPLVAFFILRLLQQVVFALLSWIF